MSKINLDPISLPESGRNINVMLIIVLTKVVLKVLFPSHWRMAGKLLATQRCLRPLGRWSRSVGFRCERGGRFEDTCPRFTPCIGALSQGRAPAPPKLIIFFFCFFFMLPSFGSRCTSRFWFPKPPYLMMFNPHHDDHHRMDATKPRMSSSSTRAPKSTQWVGSTWRPEGL